MININYENRRDCCGCTACAFSCPKNCITMHSDKEGFKYPLVNLAECINCGKCDSVCPIKNREPAEKKATEAFILRNNNPDVVKKSTSGGAVTAFCEFVLSKGGIVFGGALNDKFEVVHKSVETIEQLSVLRTSKYVQSDLSDTFLQVKSQLITNRLVLFIGTPCQVAGLKRFLGKNYDNLLTIDFVCRAVPSPLVWEKYRQLMETKFHSTISYANFREKTYGYHSANLTLQFANGKKSVENTHTDYMLKSFFDGLSARPSCHHCAFRRVDRVSDLTAFDCWNITRYVPSVQDDDKGYTSIIVQSNKGMDMLHNVRSMTTQYPVNAAKLITNCGHMALNNPPVHPAREQFFSMLNKDIPLDKISKKLYPIKLSRRIFGKFRKPLYKLGLLKLLKN